MIDPTEDEISFLQKLVLRGGELTLQGNLSLLKIDRLIPDYVTHVSASPHRNGLGACAEISAGVKQGDRVCHRKE